MPAYLPHTYTHTQTTYPLHSTFSWTMTVIWLACLLFIPCHSILQTLILLIIIISLPPSSFLLLGQPPWLSLLHFIVFVQRRFVVVNVLPLSWPPHCDLPHRSGSLTFITGKELVRCSASRVCTPVPLRFSLTGFIPGWSFEFLPSPVRDRPVHGSCPFAPVGPRPVSGACHFAPLFLPGGGAVRWCRACCLGRQGALPPCFGFLLVLHAAQSFHLQAKQRGVSGRVCPSLLPLGARLAPLVAATGLFGLVSVSTSAIWGQIVPLLSQSKQASLPWAARKLTLWKSQCLCQHMSTSTLLTLGMVVSNINSTSTCLVWLQRDQWQKKHKTDIPSVKFWTSAVTLTLNTKI